MGLFAFNNGGLRRMPRPAGECLTNTDDVPAVHPVELSRLGDPPYGVQYDPTWRSKATDQMLRATGKC